jgi:nicotinamide-nucleotide amidase
MFKTRGRDMPLNNLRQADVPKGASVIPQMPGTAPGLICPVDSKVIYAVPGVPHEMREMLRGTVVPDLRRRSGEAAVIRSRILRTWGQSESALSEILAERIKELDARANPTLAFLASGIEGLKVRITAKAPDEEKAEQILADEEARMRAIMGDIIFGVDAESMESTVIDLLRRHNLTVAVAESLTGGLVGARLTAIPGASDVFRGAVVSYASDVKYQMLDVPEGPVVNAAAAKAMASGVCNVLGSDVGLATTGVAGPSMQENQPVGTVFLGLAINGRAEAHHVRLPGDRARVRQFSVINLLNLLRLRLMAQDSEVREAGQ